MELGKPSFHHPAASATRGRDGARRRPSSRAFAWLLVVAAGCGGTKEVWIPEVTDATYPATGRILLPGGVPLKSGRVELIPVKEPGRIAVGEIGPDGTFTLKTREPGDGAVPGDYKIRIMIPERAEYQRLARYRDEDGSQLKVTIKPEPNRLEPIRLK